MTKQKYSFSLMDHPGYKEAWDKLMELRQKITQAEQEAQKLYSKERPESVKTLREKQILAVLEGKEPNTVTSTEKWREDWSKARERIQLFREAEKEQQKRLQDERLKASTLICENVRPEYSAVIKEIASKLVDLGQAILKEKDLRESLNDRDIAYQANDLLPHPFLAPGDPLDYQSRLGYWMREAVRLGYLEIEDIPQEWLDAWFKRNGYKIEKPKKTVDQVLSHARKENKFHDESKWSVEA